MIDFAAPASALARPPAPPASSLPLAAGIAIGVAALSGALLWCNRPGPAAAEATPLQNVAAESPPAGRVELFELPAFDEAQAARDLAAGRIAAPMIVAAARTPFEHRR